MGTADDLRQVEAVLGSEFADAKASVNWQTTVPDGATGSSGRLTINKTFPTDVVSVDVSISWQHDQHDQRLSLTSMASPSPTCGDRISGELESGVEWQMAEIRTLPGCVANNQTGLTFIEWDEGTNRRHDAPHPTTHDSHQTFPACAAVRHRTLAIASTTGH